MEVILNNTEHDTSVMNTFSSFLNKEEYLDVTFVCKGGRQVKAHKLVLSSVSPFLKQIFSEWKDNQDMVTILIPDIDHNILKLLLDFMYEGTMKLSRTEFDAFKTVQRLLAITFPGAVVTSPRDGPPSRTQKQESETAAISNGSLAPKIRTREPSNPVDKPQTPHRRARDPDDDAEYSFLPATSSRSTFSMEGSNLNGNAGVVPSEGEQHSHLGAASRSSPVNQEGTALVNSHHDVCNSNWSQQNGSSFRKRPYTQIDSYTEHSVDVLSAVSLEQTQGKQTGGRKKGVGLIDESANTVKDIESTQSGHTKSRKTV